MGTKAVFKISNSSLKLGMTSDGTRDNLQWLAALVLRTAEKLNLLEGIKLGIPNAIKDVLGAVQAETKDWAFVMAENENTPWVSNSAWWDPNRSKLFLHDGLFERHVKTVELPSSADYAAACARDREEYLNGMAFTD
jgi:hypothetical protein